MPHRFFTPMTGCFFVAWLMITWPAFAQKAKQAAIDLDQVDEDFAIQGEYSGRLVESTSEGWSSRKFGLQVVALGGGEFLGTLYSDGLPGSGWDRNTKFSLKGKRLAEGMELVGEQWRVIVNDGEARLASVERQLVGRLEKVERQSPTLGKTPPPNAVVIFNGQESEHLKNEKITEDGLLSEGAEITKLCQDFQLHLEFCLPYQPYARGQGRANSGVYLHRRYEVQLLDSFGLDGAINECGALYRAHPPLVNTCLPPLSWQTYDIAFTAPRFDKDGNKTRNARITVLLNGVAVQKELELKTATGGGKRVGEGPNPLPIGLQNHSNPVRFRNIWMVDFTKPNEEEADETQLSSQPSKSKAKPPLAKTTPSAIPAGWPRGPVAVPPGFAGPLPFTSLNRFASSYPPTVFPGGMVPAGVVPYYVPGYYATPQPAPSVWGW